MFDALIIKELIQGVVIELGVIVTSYRQDSSIVLTLSFGGEVFDGLLGITLELEGIYPRVS
jgi:ABC-type thiamin/hydroxymethylpyrimidine transport system permease subunit